MTDLSFAWAPDLFAADLLLDGPVLATESGLRTAVIISLFTDRRARPDDVLPAGDDRRGWWGDRHPAVDGDQIGSRLWLLNREKRTPAVLARAREYAAEALAWLVTDGVAAAVRVEAEAQGDRLAISAVIDRGGQSLRFDFVWSDLDGV